MNWRRFKAMVGRLWLFVAVVSLTAAEVSLAADTEAENDLSCVGARIKQTVNCNAGEFSAIVNIDHRSAQVAYNCVEGEYFYLNAEVSLENNNPARYDIGFFAGQDGNDPRQAAGQCSVATFPETPSPWFSNPGADDYCGDYEARSSSDDYVENIKVLCEGNDSGQLQVPYVLTYWQNDDQFCLGPANVVTGSPSKCNSGVATVTNVSVSDPPCNTNYKQIFFDDFSDGDFDGWDPTRFDETSNQYVHNKDNLSIAWNGQTSGDEWDARDWEVRSETLWWNHGGWAGSADEYGMLTYPPDLIDVQLDGTTYSVSVLMNGYIEEDQNNGMGIVFGYEDDQNYYVARWTKVGTRYTADDGYPGRPKRLTLIRVEGGSAVMLAETVLPFNTNGSHTMKVTVNENGITVCHDGVAKLNYAAERPQLQQFGLYTFDNDNGVSFDDVDVRCEDCTPRIDHFRILHDGDALTCTPEEVTVQACTDQACSALFTGAVTVSLSPTGWVGGDTVSFTGGSATAQLRHTTPGTVTLGATGVSPVVNNPTRCFIGGTESCQMTFHEAGFIFDVPTQTSCKPSTDISIQAVKKSDTGVNCAPAFTGDRTISFWSGYSDPATGTEPVYVNGNNDSNKAVAGSSPGTAVDLTFDASAIATFTVDYDDAGQMILNARYDGSGDEAGLVLTGNDIFVSVPVGLAVYATEANHDCASGDSSCSVFKRAGEAFNLDVKAACWTGDGDTDFSDNPATPNFELAGIAMGHSLVAPSGGVAGSIGITAFDMTAGDDGLKTLNQTVSEVGAFTFTATPPLYFGETIAPATSANVGRFIPDRFTLSHDTPTVGAPNPVYDDVDIDANGDGDDDDAAAGDQEDIFTYLDQPFFYDTDDALATGLSPRLLVTAVNTNGVTTQNYGGDGAGGDDFWMLVTDLGNRSYSDQTGSAATLSATLDGSNPDILAGAADYDGQGTLTLDHGTDGDELVYQRQTEEVPFDADIDLTFPAADLTDTDGVCYDVDDDGTCDDYVIPGIAGMELRFGRLAVYDAYGSELQDLDLPVAAEYYDDITGGGQGFVVNSDDTITSLVVGEFDDKNFSGNLQDGDTDPIAATLVAGDGSVTMSAPGAGNDGEADVEALLGPADADIPWLLYDWDGGGAFDDNPTGHATFGIYQGNQHHIYLREQY